MILKNTHGNAGAPALRAPVAAMPPASSATGKPAAASGDNAGTGSPGSGSPLPGSGEGSFAAAMTRAAQAPAPAPPQKPATAPAPAPAPASGPNAGAPAKAETSGGTRARRAGNTGTAAGPAKPQPPADAKAATTAGQMAEPRGPQASVPPAKSASAASGKTAAAGATHATDSAATTPASWAGVDPASAAAVNAAALAAQAVAGSPAPTSIAATSGAAAADAAGDARASATQIEAGNAADGAMPTVSGDAAAGATPMLAGGTEALAHMRATAGNAVSAIDIPATAAPAAVRANNDLQMAAAGRSAPPPGAAAAGMKPAGPLARDPALDPDAAPQDKNPLFADVLGGFSGAMGSTVANATATPDPTGAVIAELPTRPAGGASDAATAPALAALTAAGAASGAAATVAGAAPAVLHIATRVGDPGFGQDLSRQIVSLTKTGAQSAELTLNPEHLGPVSISIQMNGQEASLSITAADEATRTALREALPQLNQLFAQGGLQLGSTHVGDGSERHAGQQARPGEHQGAFAAASRQIAPTAAVSTTAGPAAGAVRLVDTFA
jgi:flagellar hook-length control protein FliK